MGDGFTYLLIVLCLTMLSVSMLRRSQQRTANARDLTREQLARLKDQKHIQGAMEELLLQLEDVSRRVNAQVDTRFAKLEAVIRDADRRIEQLAQQTSGAPPARPPRPQTPRPDKAEPEAFTPGLTSAQDSPPEKTASSPQAPAAKAAPPPAHDVKGGAPAQGRQGNALSREQRRQRVYEMADQGTPAITIADTLRIPLGEVELLLNLRKYR